MEALDTLAAGDDGVRATGVVAYFEEFFDVVDDRAPWQWKECSTFTPEEVGASGRVELLLQACAATPGVLATDEVIGTGRPGPHPASRGRGRFAMRARGRFREDVEEDQPSRL